MRPDWQYYTCSFSFSMCAMRGYWIEEMKEEVLTSIH